MQAYRLVKARWAATALTGDGARLWGGRWNSPGTALLYAADSIALAALELLVHLRRAEVLDGYLLYTLTLPDDTCVALDPRALPADWRTQPAPPSTARIGDTWIRAGVDAAATLALQVPSVIVPREHNLLLNPAHPAFPRVVRTAASEPFAYDCRLHRAQTD